MPLILRCLVPLQKTICLIPLTQNLPNQEGARNWIVNFRPSFQRVTFGQREAPKKTSYWHESGTKRSVLINIAQESGACISCTTLSLSLPLGLVGRTVNDPPYLHRTTPKGGLLRPRVQNLGPSGRGPMGRSQDPSEEVKNVPLFVRP